MSDHEKAAQRSVFEAAAYATALRTAGHFAATENALVELGHTLDVVGLDPFTRDVAKVAELHRLASVRFAAIVRRMGEGS